MGTRETNVKILMVLKELIVIEKMNTNMNSFNAINLYLVLFFLAFCGHCCFRVAVIAAIVVIDFVGASVIVLVAFDVRLPFVQGFC